MKVLYFLYLILILNLNACSKVRESAGVTRKSIDEFKAIENPPLVVPPDFNLVPPDQLQQKNIENIENELAQEILFGLDQKEHTIKKQTSTMNQIISKANATNISSDIRDEINQEFYQEKNTKGIYQVNWESEVEVLDAVEESERIRNKKFQNKSIADGDILIKKEKIKVKKKKRFLFF